MLFQPSTGKLSDLLPIMPLYERLHIFAEMEGEKIRPAFYNPRGDANGTTDQTINLTTPPNEGPFVIHQMSVPLVSGDGTATITQRRLAISIDGTSRVKALIAAMMPTSLQAPLIMRPGSTLQTRVVAEGGAFSAALSMWCSGFHCTARFAEKLRAMGELWGDEFVYPAGSPPSTLQTPQFERDTLLEYMAPDATANVPATATAITIRLGDNLLTPNALAALGIATNIGFGRAAPTDLLSGRIHHVMRRGQRITVVSNHTAGTLRLGFLGRQVF